MIQKMKFKVLEFFEIHCHECNEWLEAGEVLIRNEVAYCMLCKTKLGYLKDIPARFRGRT